MAFTLSSITKLGVYPANGGYACSLSSESDWINKEFTFNYLMFTQGTNASGSWYVNHSEGYDELYSDAKLLFVNWIYTQYGSTPEYEAENNFFYPLSSISIQQSAESENKWECSCTFKNRKNDEDYSENQDPTASPVFGTTDVKYSLGAGNTHITRSLSTSALWTKTGRSVVDYNNRIDFNDGETKGVDIVTPQLSFSISVNFSTLTAQSLSTIMSMVGTTNNAIWGSFPAGTVLFRGGDITSQVWDKSDSYQGIYWKATFNFEYSPNTTITTPSGTTAQKGGWQYVWSKREKSTVNNVINDEIVQINKETIYPSSDFTNLGIVWSS